MSIVWHSNVDITLTFYCSHGHGAMITTEIDKQIIIPFRYLWRSHRYQHETSWSDLHISLRQQKCPTRTQRDSIVSEYQSFSNVFLLLFQKLLHILHPTLMLLLRAIERSPNWLPLKQPHGMNAILLIDSKTMINPLGESHEIPTFDMDTDPFVVFRSDVEKPWTREDVADFFGVVNVFFKECFYLHAIFGILHVVRSWEIIFHYCTQIVNQYITS